MATPEANLNLLEDSVNDTTYELARVKDWLAAMGDRGIINANGVRLRTTAIEAFESILGSDEQRTVGYMLANIDTIADRWTTKKNGNPETGQTYRARAKGALEDFLKYQLDPTGFKMKAKAPPKASNEAPRRAVKEDPQPQQTVVATPPSTNVQPERNYPLGDGNEFFYRLPLNGIEVKDILRITCHLITMAKDFDPTNQSHSSLFALARVEK